MYNGDDVSCIGVMMVDTPARIALLEFIINNHKRVFPDVRIDM